MKIYRQIIKALDKNNGNGNPKILFTYKSSQTTERWLMLILDL